MRHCYKQGRVALWLTTYTQSHVPKWEGKRLITCIAVIALSVLCSVNAALSSISLGSIRCWFLCMLALGSKLFVIAVFCGSCFLIAVTGGALTSPAVLEFMSHLMDHGNEERVQVAHTTLHLA